MRRLRSVVGLLAAVCACVVSACGTGLASIIPDGTGVVQIVSAVPGAPPQVAMTVTRPSRTRQIVAWIDRLAAVPRGVVYNCPLLDAVEPTVTLTFRAAAAGLVLARAAETDYGFGSGPCNAMALTVPGHKPVSLVGGQFLERLQRLLRVNFGFGIGSIQGGIYLAGGPAASKLTTLAGQVKLYLAHPLPAYGRGPLMVATIPHPKQHLYLSQGPGVYTLIATSLTGRASGCPPVTVTVRVGQTTHTAVPYGCAVKAPAVKARAAPGDPAALSRGRWQELALSPIGAPAGASLTWDGAKLLLVGGGAPGGSSNLSRSVAQFDPVTDTWQRAAPVPPSVTADDAATVWTGARLFVLGGTGPKANRATGIAGLYDPYADRWTTSPPAPVMLAGSSVKAVWSGGRVVLAAVNYQHGTLQTATYDPARNRWASLPLSLPARHAPPLDVEMVATGDGVLLWSLWSRSHRLGSGSYSLTSGVDVYRLTDGRWRLVTGAWPQDQTVDQPLLAGSQVLLGASQTWCGTCTAPPRLDTNGWSLNPATLAITKLPHGPLDDAQPQILWANHIEIALNRDGEISGPSEHVMPGDIAFLNPVTGRWYRGPAAPQTLGEPTSVWDGTHLLALSRTGRILSYGPPVTGRVILDADRVPSGGTVRGEVVFENHTARTVVMMSGCAVNGLFTIGFMNAAGQSQGSAFTTVGCSPHQHLVARPGTTVYRFKLRATYTTCSGASAKGQPPKSSPAWNPVCLKARNGRRDIMPHLPSGAYTAFFVPEAQWRGPTVVPAKLTIG